MVAVPAMGGVLAAAPALRSGAPQHRGHRDRQGWVPPVTQSYSIIF